MKNGGRIKELRKALGLTQEEFGKKLSLKQTTISAYESGQNEVPASVIVLLCKTFSVSENWIRTGDGDMFVHRSRDEEIVAWVANMMADENAAFQRRFALILSRLSVDEWVLLEKMVTDLASSQQMLDENQN